MSRNNSGDNQKKRKKKQQSGKKELEEKIFESCKKSFDAQKESLDSHLKFLEQVIPSDFLTKVSCGHTLEFAFDKISKCLESYFAQVDPSLSLNLSGDSELLASEIISFLGRFNAWYDNRVEELGKKMKEDIVTLLKAI